MTRLLDVQTPELTIVFGRTKRRVMKRRTKTKDSFHGNTSR